MIPFSSCFHRRHIYHGRIRHLTPRRTFRFARVLAGVAVLEVLAPSAILPGRCQPQEGAPVHLNG